MQERIETHLDRLFGFAFALTRDRDRAGDLVQECALRALAAARVPADDRAFVVWLFRILRNAFVDQCRRSGHETVFDPELEDSGDPDAGWTGDRRMIDVVTVRIAMAKLSVSHREIITLIDFVGQSYEEAAQVIGVPPGTVMSRLSRARRALLALLEADNVTPISRARRPG